MGAFGDDFYMLQSPTNSVKALMGKMVCWYQSHEKIT